MVLQEGEQVARWVVQRNGRVLVDPSNSEIAEAWSGLPRSVVWGVGIPA